MALSVNVAGQWTSTVQFPAASATALGINMDGWQITWKQLGKTLRKTDKFGDTPIERFLTGIQMSVGAVFHEWLSPELKFLTVANDIIAATGTQVFNLGLVGTQVTDTAGVLVLSSVANTPARVNSFSTITFHAVSVDEDFPVDFTLGPDKTVLPFRGVVWPATISAGVYGFFTTA